MAFEYSREIVAAGIQLVILLAGLPLLVTWIARLISQRGVGLPVDGAWSDVCWGRVAGGFEFVIAFMVVHIALTAGMVFFIQSPLGLDKWSDPVAAGLVSTLLMCGQWVVTCGMSLGVIVFAVRGRVAAIGLTSSRFGRSVASGVAGFLAIMPAVLVTLFAASIVHQWVTHDKPLGQHPILTAVSTSNDFRMIVAYFAVAGLAIPFFEELFYRGLIQTTLMRTGNGGLAIVLTSILFGMSHASLPDAPVGVPAIIVLSLGLGYVYYRTRSLWAPVTLHALFNIFNLALQIGAAPLAQFLNNL